MSFTNRTEFTTAQSSEKITLAHVEARQRILPWTLVSGTVYKKTVQHFVIRVHNTLTELSAAADEFSLSSGTYFYKSTTNELFLDIGVDPENSEIIATYRLFFSSAPISAPHNLSAAGINVGYQGRIQLAPPYKHKIGIQQNLVSIIGNGSLKLINNDGALDEIYDKLIFDNQNVFIYSWNRQLPIADAKIIYRGKITNKRFQSDNVSFEVKDQLIDLEQNVPQIPYDDTDNVTDAVKGTYKRWVYGRVDGLQLQSTDQVGEGYPLTGTVTTFEFPLGTDVKLTGTGTLFKAEVSPEDRITVGTQEFTVKTVVGDTTLIINESDYQPFQGQSATIVPDIQYYNKNRDFFVAGHASSKLTKQVVNALQLNRVELNNTEGLRPGDFIEFASGERVEIRNTFGNLVVLVQNLLTLPTVTTDVVRQPVQKVYIESTLVPEEKYTISNLGAPTNETTLSFAADTEFSIARTVSLGFDATFTNSQFIVTTTDDIDLREILKPRDYIVPNNIAYTTLYEVAEVEEQQILLRTLFTDATITDAVDGRKPKYINDDTIVSADVLGRTETGEPAGEWITTAAQAMRDVIKSSGITNINEATFTAGALSNAHLISIALPFTPGASQVKYKDVIDRLAKSTTSVVTLDNNLNLKYKVLNAEIPSTVITINDFDVIKWKMETISGKLIRNTIVNYRFSDIDRSSQEKGNKTFTFSSEFVQKYVGTDNTEEVDAYLYDTVSAEILAHRNTYNNTLGRTDISIETDLRLENVEIGDIIIMDFARMYKRFGDATTRKKAALVVGKTLNGERTTLDLTDYGNILNRSSLITPNSAPDWTAATVDEKILYGYITDAEGLVEDEEDTANTHLIS